MANTIAIAEGHDRNKKKRATRLGSEFAEVRANTYKTFSEVRMRKDGSGYMTVLRGSEVLASAIWEKE